MKDGQTLVVEWTVTVVYEDGDVVGMGDTSTKISIPILYVLDT